MLDLLIKNGRIVDGSGAPWFKADIGVIGDRIVYVGSGHAPEAATTLDTSGMLVAPGFIDIHSHADTAVFREPGRSAKVSQGVTTEVVGNCGLGVAPVNSAGRAHLIESEPEVYRLTPFTWLSLSEYMSAVPRAGVNVACLVPHGCLRLSVMGFDARPALPAEIDRMCWILDEGMEDGAFGLSTALAYVPMSSSLTEEILTLCKRASRAGGFLASHMRNYREKVRQGVDEMVIVARETGIPVHISHYQAFGAINWGRAHELDQWPKEARQRGLDLTFDSYPYDYSAGFLKNTVPAKYHEGGVDGLVSQLRRPAVRNALRAEIGTVTTYDLNLLAISGVSSPSLEKYIGLMLPEAAQDAGKDPVDFLCDVLIEDPGTAHVNFQGSAPDTLLLSQSDLQMVGSDSIDLLPGQGKPHPRLWGSFPRFFRLYVREAKALSWERAVYKMTGFPAWRLGLSSRGLLKEGFYADITVFDPNTIADAADLRSPEAQSVGVSHVVVNGVIELANGKPTGKMGGRVLKRGES